MRNMICGTFTPQARYGSRSDIRPEGLNPLYFVLIVKHEVSQISGLRTEAIADEDTLYALGLDSLDMEDLYDRLEKGLDLGCRLKGKFTNDSTISQAAEACRLACQQNC